MKTNIDIGLAPFGYDLLLEICFKVHTNAVEKERELHLTVKELLIALT
jgi:hypothetical protein